MTRSSALRKQARLSQDWSLSPAALIERFELGRRVERNLWMENDFTWEPLAETLHIRHARGAADVRGWTRKQQVNEAAALRDDRADIPVHDPDCPCIPCEGYWKRLIYELLPHPTQAQRKQELATA